MNKVHYRMHLFWVLLLFPGSLHQKILEFAITLLIISLNQENFTAAGSNDFFFLNQKKKKSPNKQTEKKDCIYPLLITYTTHISVINPVCDTQNGLKKIKTQYWFLRNKKEKKILALKLKMV